MKKITESNLRLIIKEEITKLLTENEMGGMSILPPDATPELFAKAYNMFWGADERLKNAFNDERKRKFYAFELVHGGMSPSPLTQQEAEEWAMLASICMDMSNKENYQYNYRTIVPVIGKALRTKKESIFIVSGEFDPLTYNEFKLLKTCKSKCDLLIVGVHSDAYMKLCYGRSEEHTSELQSH